jgi:radical SAM protein with 4Fe4S-binding SPASM domain
MKHLIKHLYSVFLWHIWADVREGNLAKPWHFIVANLKRRLFGYPYVALIETGNYCNLQCPTCPTPASKICRQKELMSFDNFKKVIDNIKDSIHVALLYYTNEPLLSPDIFRMAEYAHDRGLYLEISTNATLLNEKKTKELFDSKVDKVIVDFDGTTKEAYEQFRVGADFNQVLKNIKHLCFQKQALKLKKPFIDLQFVLNKFNQNQVAEVKRIAKELKVDRLSIRSFALGKYAYSQEERKALTDKFFPDTKEYQEKVRYKKTGDELDIKNSPKKCPLAKSHLVVLVDGRVSMCCYDLNGQRIYGNVFVDKLKDIWFNPKVRAMRKQAENRGYALCQNCSIYD